MIVDPKDVLIMLVGYLAFVLVLLALQEFVLLPLGRLLGWA